MTRVGILLDSTDCSKYLHATIRELAQNDRVELYFLINEGDPSKRSALHKAGAMTRSRGIWHIINLGFFRMVIGIEARLLSILSESVKSHFETMNVASFSGNEVLSLSPQFSNSGLIVRYADEDLERIKALDLDLLIRGNSPGIFKGGIVRAAKGGILSFHHGDNRWNRGGPAGFWEVYLRRPSTGFVIQVLTEELDGGLVLFRGEVRTQRSFTENQMNVYSISNSFLAKTVLDYAAAEAQGIEARLPEPEEPTAFGGELLTVPNLAQSSSYLARTSWLFLSLAMNRVVFRRDDRWSVAFLAGSWRGATLRRGVEIENPPNRYFADPFVATKNGRTVCFVEDYSYATKRGSITAVELRDEKRYEILGPVIEESFHMSFPYIFEWKDELFMIPETCDDASIRLYRCVEFPMKWRFEKAIMTGVDAVDSMVFELEGRWWLLTTLATDGIRDHMSQLMAFYSDRPDSDEWCPHEMNPLIFDSTIARNGGILDATSGAPVRCRQKQGFNQYGEALSLSRILELTPSSFKEEHVGSVTPDFFPKLKGCHHMHSDDRYVVYDYLRLESRR